MMSLLLSLLLLTPSPAADWPQFRGPDGNGVARAEVRPAITWSGSQNVKWKTTLPGPGSSSPIISGERLFVTCYSGYGDGSSEGSPEKLQRHLLCVERQTGRIIWRKSIPAELPEDSFTGYLTEHGYASSTPVTDVFAAQRDFKLVAQNKLEGDDSDFNGTPALAGNQLFLRSNRFLYCIEPKAGG